MNRNLTSIAIFGVIFLIIVISLSNSIFLTIDAGERGVLFKRFAGGLDKENIYQTGFHVIAPWNTMHVYTVRERQREESMDVLSSNGLSIFVEVSTRFNPVYDEIGFLHEKFGQEYTNNLVIPEARSAVRDIVGKFTPEELYATKRDTVQKLILETLRESLKRNHVDLRAVLIRSIQLPQDLQLAIERKLKEEQSALEYVFRLQREEQEAERRRIDAEGRATANRIVSASLTEQILRERGIDATLELAKSPNSKVVVIGSGDDGLPLILGGN